MTVERCLASTYHCYIILLGLFIICCGAKTYDLHDPSLNGLSLTIWKVQHYSLLWTLIWKTS